MTIHFAMPGWPVLLVVAAQVPMAFATAPWFLTASVLVTVSVEHLSTSDLVLDTQKNTVGPNSELTVFFA